MTMTSSIQVSEEMIADAKRAFEQGEGLSLEYRLGNVLLAMRAKEPLAQGDEAIARIVAEAIASTSAGNGNAVSEAASRIAALVRSKLPIDREALNGVFSAGWLTRHERPDVQPQDAFEIYWASKDEERHA